MCFFFLFAFFGKNIEAPFHLFYVPNYYIGILKGVANLFTFAID